VAVLRRRDFRLMFAAQAVSHFGDRMVPIALAFAVLELGGSATEVGLVLASQTFALVACLLIGGVVADRVSRRAVMVISDLVRLASQGALAALLLVGEPEIWMLAPLAAVTGAASGFFNPAATGLLPTVVPPEQLQQANGLRATAMSGGEILGPALAGILIAAAGPGWALAVDAGTFAVSAAFLVRLRPPARAVREPASFLGDLREGWSEFSSRTWLWVVVGSIAIGGTVWPAWNVLGPVLADQELGGAAVWGAVVAFTGVGSVVGSLAAIRVSPRRPLFVTVIVWSVFAIPIGLLAAEAPVPLLAAGAMLIGVSMMLGNALWESNLQRHIPAGSLSRVSAYDWFGSMAFYPVGMAIWGPIAAAIGISEALWLACALLLVVSLVPLCIREIRTLPAYPGAE
jgi:predicted MFS family arabinose efflux permease